ncbi:MAG: sugar-binding protein, partial [Ignavibacteriaceae bacterium]
ATALDVVGDWYQLKIPLFEREQPGAEIPNDEGFILAPTSWGGFTYNNSKLDWDKIVGYNIGIITTGWAPPLLPADSIEVSFDAFTRFGTKAVPFIIFNGMETPGNLAPFTWGQSSVMVEEGTGATTGTNSLKWTQGDEWSNGWTGFGYDISNGPLNMAGSWVQDSIRFKMKAPSGTGDIRLQFESPGDPTEKVGQLVTPIGDDQWHDYAFPLNAFVDQDGTTEFDSSAVIVFGIMAEGNAVAGTEVYFDDVWTGNPDFDVIPPAPPTDILATVVQDYLNSVIWTDVPGESGETYTVYYSESPISDVEAPGVEVVAARVPEGTELVNHPLRAPVDDASVSYYYAIVCKDEAGNKSDVSDNTPALTNLAEGVPVISPTAPTGFAADGDLSDWAGITPFRMFISDGSGTVVTNTTIDNDADLSVLAYVAMDNEYLYIAYDVVDDIVNADTTHPNPWEMDSPDLFIGLYNWHGAPHTSYQGDDEPDYHFRFSRNQAVIDNAGGHVILRSSDANYYWEERFEPGYVVEAKISFADIAAVNGDDLFMPIVGMRIPIDFSVNDADTGIREGIITYSPFNEDLSYQDVSRWLYTWIGDQWVGVEDEDNVVLSYELAQNYPNPFNPVTQIQYSLEQSSNVTLRVFDVLGREVVTLINENQNAGRHVVNFDASNFASGIYFYRLEAGSFIQVKKMILMK